MGVVGSTAPGFLWGSVVVDWAFVELVLHRSSCFVLVHGPVHRG